MFLKFPAFSDDRDVVLKQSNVSDCANVTEPSEQMTTVLLAEDDPAVRGFISSLLEQAGCKVLLAEHGRKALGLCQNYPGFIDVMITDVVMPEVNGRELAESAKQMRPSLKVLFVSGYVDRGLKEEDIDNPCYAFLEKPFTAEALYGALCALCPAPAFSAGRFLK
jgi:CheY-like chemotaxis protein